MSRLTTNQCKSISVKFFKQGLYFHRGGKGRANWTNFINPAGQNGIDFIVSMASGDEHVRFIYGWVGRFTKEKLDLDYPVKLTPTSCYFGGRRWWFRCPLDKGGQPCSRRVGVLYLGGGEYFGCRHCYNLTYESSQDSHRFERMAKKHDAPHFKVIERQPKSMTRDQRWKKF